MFVINTWLKETLGTQYRYFVETLADGNRIYLLRPARLNKGCDFVIHAENRCVWKNGNDKPPSHKFLFEQLESIKQSSTASEWDDALSLITKVYHCENIFPNAVVSPDLELCLQLVKWFFIEQDVTYWNHNGREMLYNAIQEKF